MRDFLAMGGYGAFVWSAYGLAAIVLVGLLWLSVRLTRRREAELAGLRQSLRAARPRPARPIVPRREDASGSGVGNAA